MSIKFGAVVFGAASLLLACEARALTFELGETFNGASPSSTAPWLTATFSQGVNGTVNLALQSSLEISSEFFGSLGFNFNPNKTLSGVTQNGGAPAIVNWSLNGENLQGGGNVGMGFDVMINFETANGSRFQGTDLINFIFSGTTPLVPTDFNFFSANDLQIAAHVQGIPNGPSGAVKGVQIGETTVPDGGSTLILLGIGTTLFALVRRTFAS
jgi:hypothetical protein